MTAVRAVDAQAYPISDSRVRVVPRRGPPSTVSTAMYAVLARCGSFAPLDLHERRLGPEAGPILRELLARGLLESVDDLLGAAPRTARAQVTLEEAVVVTSDPPGKVEAALRDFVRRASTWGRRLRIHLFPTSPDFKGVVTDSSADVVVRLPEHATGFLDRVCRQAGVAGTVFEGPLAARAMNAALLCSAGPIWLTDGSGLRQPALLDLPGRGLRIDSSSEPRSVRRHTTSDLRPDPVDEFALHERYLGRSIGDLLADPHDGYPPRIMRAGRQFSRMLVDGPVDVIATVAGMTVPTSADAWSATSTSAPTIGMGVPLDTRALAFDPAVFAPVPPVTAPWAPWLAAASRTHGCVVHLPTLYAGAERPARGSTASDLTELAVTGVEPALRVSPASRWSLLAALLRGYLDQPASVLADAVATHRSERVSMLAQRMVEPPLNEVDPDPVDETSLLTDRTALHAWCALLDRWERLRAAAAEVRTDPSAWG